MNAYTALLKKGRCVVCREQSHQTLYGVPICSKPCQRKWKFDFAEWPALSSELMAQIVVSDLRDDNALEGVVQA